MTEIILVVALHARQFDLYALQHIAILTHLGLEPKVEKNQSHGRYFITIGEKVHTLVYIPGDMSRGVHINGYEKDTHIVWIEGDRELSDHVNDRFRYIHTYAYI